MRSVATVLGVVAIASSSLAGAPSRGRVVRVDKPRTVEVFVPAGTFYMGIDEDSAGAALNQCQVAFYPPGSTPRLQNALGQWQDFCDDYAKEMAQMQPREVVLDAYAIDRDEVSVADYRACVAAGGCSLDALIAGDERYIRDDWPMVNTTWEEAQRYCQWRGARLPTEAEWERAARGDAADAVWPWGVFEQPEDFNHGQARALAMLVLERRALYLPIKFFGDPDDSDGTAVLASRGTYPWGESPWGTRDQAGNVAEWTADAYFGDDRNKGYTGLSAINPLREGGAMQTRVVRGGSWRQPAFIARSNLRDPFNKLYEPSARFSHVGFRCARSLR
ncbi:MAG: formylglycine-generating enzyme family protein [Kofleriaceae bacterium]|nr:formylglycine-generating enzyme family protein [Kofleriaceae bacterium]